MLEYLLVDLDLKEYYAEQISTCTVLKIMAHTKKVIVIDLPLMPGIVFKMNVLTCSSPMIAKFTESPIVWHSTGSRNKSLHLLVAIFQV